jgi:phospholipid transport system substrate-binding protein
MTLRKYEYHGILFLLLFVICSVNPSNATAGEPTEEIRRTTDRIIAVVSDPALKSPENASERKKLIREAVDERFDWDEMSRRTLARNWVGRTDDEKKEFIDLFGKLLERTYLEKVEDYSGEKVSYIDEKIDGDYAIVKVNILTKNDREIPVVYRLKSKDDKWFVYDILIEGVSLINNYRSQFNSIITRSSYQGLIKKLRDTVEEK